MTKAEFDEALAAGPWAELLDARLRVRPAADSRGRDSSQRRSRGRGGAGGAGLSFLRTAALAGRRGDAPSPLS